MSNPFLVAVSQAEKNFDAANLQCAAAKQDMHDALDTSQVAWQRLQSVKSLSATEPEPFSILCIPAAQAELERFRKVARDAKITFDIRTKELKNAKEELAQSWRDCDAYSVLMGELKHFEEKSEGAIGQWRAKVNAAFEDYSKITAFPAPPALAPGAPHSHGCPNRVQPRVKFDPTKPIDACYCSIARIFAPSAFNNRGPIFNLRTERWRWDPELFPEQFRPEAKYVFDIMNRMYDAGCQPAQQ